jgi:predicted DNA-binding antitoxin AbrB/MazE fold protein
MVTRKQRKELFDMEAVEAYYDGRVFIPKKHVRARENQSVLVILDSFDTDTDDHSLPKISRSEIKAMMKGSITESLIGIISDPDITLEEIRAERLSKYERTD